MFPRSPRQDAKKLAPNECHRLAEKSKRASENFADSILTRVTFLKKRQRKYIVSTWLAVQDRTEFGIRVYAEVFHRQPQLQALFPSVQRLPSAQTEIDLGQSALFRSQAAAFSNFLDYIVSFVHLDSGNFISEASFQMGRRHSERLKHLDSLPDDWWRAITDGTLDCLSGYFPTNDTFVGRFPFGKYLVNRSYRRAWEKLLNVVCDQMQRGFAEFRKEAQLRQEKGTLHPVAVSPCQAQWQKLAALAARRRDDLDGVHGNGIRRDDDSSDSEDNSSSCSSD